MKLKKELPKIFEEFAEQRKNSFLTVKGLKEKNIPIVGVFCTYLPQEIINAMGAVCVGLCSTSDETVSDAEKDLPRNLCPLIKSSYGFAKTDKCPFFYFSDLIVGETTCDGKKKMYEHLATFKPVHVVELPNSQSENGLKLYREEIIKFKKKLEENFEVEITEDQIREQIKIRNKMRKVLLRIQNLMKAEPAPVTGMDITNIVYGSQFKFDSEKTIDEINSICDKIEKEYKEGKHLEHKKRILVTGSPVSGAASKAIKAIEDNGGVVVGFENCGGMKPVREMVDENEPDVYTSLARKYLNIGCSCMSPNPNRYDLIGQMIEEFNVDGVIDIELQACHTYNVEAYGIKKFVKEKYNIPYMNIETDYSQSDIEQLNTRMAAFIELL